jgi:CrcB protein
VGKWAPYAVVAAGGAVGAVLRVAGGLLPGSVSFPWSTLAINVSGSFLLGAILTLSLEAERIGPDARLFLSTGVLGAFTTFSSFAAQVVQLWSRSPAAAAGYGLGSLAGGMAAVLAGQVAVRAVWLRPVDDAEGSATPAGQVRPASEEGE